ncbi:MAG: L,D-transpeptidase family protein [Sulfurovum sp.]|nr:L,D-transpeptidase family protein [Sulfurovum sp.]
MHIFNKTFIYFPISLSMPLFFIACNPTISTDKYNLDECRAELLEANDYEKDGGIDRIVVVKKERTMYLYKEGKVQQTIPISLGKNPIGAKQQKGDFKTPEGDFFIHRKLCSGKYYRSLCISYPGAKDIAKAKRRGFNPGKDITIHAQPVWNADGKGDAYTLSKDWTEGCVAVTNEAMKELWYAVHEGVPITIR